MSAGHGAAASRPRPRGGRRADQAEPLGRAPANDAATDPSAQLRAAATAWASASRPSANAATARTLPPDRSAPPTSGRHARRHADAADRQRRPAPDAGVGIGARAPSRSAPAAGSVEDALLFEPENPAGLAVDRNRPAALAARPPAARREPSRARTPRPPPARQGAGDTRRDRPGREIERSIMRETSAREPRACFTRSGTGHTPMPGPARHEDRAVGHGPRSAARSGRARNTGGSPPRHPAA